MWGRSEPNPEINTSSLYVLSEAISWMRTLPEGILRKAASGSFVTYFFCFPLPSLLSPSFSPQHYEESQLKRTRGKSHTERFGRLQGQPNSHRIHRQQFQRQKKWQVNIVLNQPSVHTWQEAVCVLILDLFNRKHSDLLIKHFLINGLPGGRMLNDSCLFTSICFAANRGIQCSMQVRTRGCFMAL